VHGLLIQTVMWAWRLTIMSNLDPEINTYQSCAWLADLDSDGGRGLTSRHTWVQTNW